MSSVQVNTVEATSVLLLQARHTHMLVNILQFQESVNYKLDRKDLWRMYSRGAILPLPQAAESLGSDPLLVPSNNVTSNVTYELQLSIRRFL